MPNLKKRKLFLSIVSIVSLITVLLILYVLFKYRSVVNLESFLWIFGLIVAIILILIGILFTHDAWNCGRKKKDVRFS